MEKTKRPRTEPWGTTSLQVWGEEEGPVKETEKVICEARGKAREHKVLENKWKRKLSGRRESTATSIMLLII